MNTCAYCGRRGRNRCDEYGSEALRDELRRCRKPTADQRIDAMHAAGVAEPADYWTAIEALRRELASLEDNERRNLDW